MKMVKFSPDNSNAYQYENYLGTCMYVHVHVHTYNYRYTFSMSASCKASNQQMNLDHTVLVGLLKCRHVERYYMFVCTATV